jgi:type IV pilus assembly protein PilA
MSGKSHKLKGFTLIEILVVVALIAILAAVTIIAINPAKNFADTRNATRSADVTTILNAITQYTSEEGHAIADLGGFPTCVADGSAVDRIGSCADLDCEDIAIAGTPNPLVDEYLVAIPVDPTTGSDADTGYTICLTSGGRVEIDAPDAENGATITVKR